jgi:two-component system chemotaxis response regulator CheY
MTTVMLIDDSRTILMSLSAILTRNGFTVETASDGRDALAKLAAASVTRPDLIISDLNMPHMDGIEFVREVRKDVAMRSTPILMLSTESEEAKRQEAKSAGATGWLVKPIGAESLLKVISRVLPAA